MTRVRLLLLGAVAITAIGGCGQESDPSDLQDFVNEVNSRPSMPIPQLPKLVPLKPFNYSAFQMRSPFKPTERVERQVNNNIVPAPDMNRPKQYLERFSLDSFNMVGSLSDDTGSFALLKVNGNVYRVQKDDYIGFNYGKVTRITDDEIDVTEVLKDSEDNWTERQRILKLRESGK